MANNGKEIITLKLVRGDVGQVIDGLIVRRDSWRATARYLEGEEVDCVVEECSDSEEAGWVADNYHRIIALIRAQMG